MSADRIITDFIHPPIPIRSCDWAAYRDGYEPGCGEPYGHGATEAEAIADLLEQEAANEPLPAPPETKGA